MDNASTGRVKELLAKNDKIGILVGKNPSLDQMAGALSLYRALTQMGKTVIVASPTEPIVANSSLVGIDKVKTVLSGDGGDLIVSFPYREGEIEKVSYTLEDGFLNIVVKATEEGLSFVQEDVAFKRSGGLPGLLFIVGTARLSDLEQLFDADSLKDTSVINVDNQNDNQRFGDVVLVSQQASSVSELIGSLLGFLQIEIDQDSAQNLLSGMGAATNNFQDINTSFLAFEMAAACMKKGARRTTQVQFKPQESTKSPFGPFTMPQPKQATVPQRNDAQQGSHFPKQAQGQPREQKSASDRPSRDGQRPWEQKPQQVRQPQPVSQPQQVQPRPIQEVEHKETTTKDESETPPDWLSPKVYKSSTLI